MFGASVTGLTLVSFALMVGSSIIAAWSDIRHAVTSTPVLDPITGLDIAAPAHTLAGVNIGYIWMALNCVASAAYVLYMRKRIKVTGFKDWDSMFYNNLLSIPVLVVASVVVEDWGSASLTRNLYVLLIYERCSEKCRIEREEADGKALLTTVRFSSRPLPFLAPPPFSSRTPPPGVCASAAAPPTLW